MKSGWFLYKVLPLSLVCIYFQFCTVVQKAKTGEDAYELKQYFVAAGLFEKEFENNPNPTIKAKLAYGAGQSYLKINETNQAINWFKIATELDYGDLAWKEYGLALVQQGDYDEAIRIFETAINKKGNSEELRLLVSGAKQAKALALERLQIYSVMPLELNTSAAEYAPAINPNGDLVFTSDRPAGVEGEIYKWTGRQYSDLFIGQATGSQVHPMDQVLNSIGNEGSACFNQAGNVFLFTRCGLTTNADHGYCKLFMSMYADGKWGEPMVLNFQKENINYMHPCFAANDSVIFFAADDERGEGGFDIYYTEWTENTWSEPERLGKRINTRYQEKFPYMFQDTLYFASDRLGGLGGLDIYKTFLNSEGDWLPPINLRAPINSHEDDFALVVDPQSTTSLKGFFSSSRLGGAGKDDIYSFERTQTDESIVNNSVPTNPVDPPAKKTINYQLFLSVKVVQAIRANPEDPNSPIVEKKPIPNTSILLKEGATPIQLNTGANGFSVSEIKYDQDYFVLGTGPGLLNASKSFKTFNEKDPLNPVKTINVEIVLDKAYAGKEILIADIFYDLDKWFIRQDAEPSLNQLVQLLKDNPKIKIQLASHTDCRGSDVYNLELSDKRARSAMEYLVKNNIPAERLSSKGFGENLLIQKCVCEQCTEEQHQANRRTTFTIMN